MDLVLKLAKYTSTRIPFPSSLRLLEPALLQALPIHFIFILNLQALHVHQPHPANVEGSARYACSEQETQKHHHRKRTDSSRTRFFQPFYWTKVGTEWTKKNPNDAGKVGFPNMETAFSTSPFQVQSWVLAIGPENSEVDSTTKKIGQLPGNSAIVTFL